MKKITLGILGAGSVASHLIDYAMEYPGLIDIKMVAMQDVDKPRFFDRYRINKTNDIDQIVSDPDIDVVIDCLPGIDVPQKAMIDALNNKKTVISCGKQVWNREGSQLIIDAAIQNDQTVWLNSIVANRNNYDLVVPENLTHLNIKNYPHETLYVNRHAEGVQTALAILKDILKILGDTPENKIIIDKDEIKRNHNQDFKELDNGMIVIENFLQSEEMDQLSMLIANMTPEQITQYKMYKQYEKFKGYCEQFLNRTDYENVLREGVVHGGLAQFNASEAIPVPTKIVERVQNLVKNYFKGPCLIKDFDEMQFLPELDGTDSMDEHVDMMNNLYAAFGMVIYVNDNYEGGDLYFPVKNISIKPKKNSLIIFDASSKEAVHGVKKVISGKRYAIPSFVWMHLYPDN